LPPIGSDAEKLLSADKNHIGANVAHTIGEYDEMQPLALQL
jgi:hypothetical protein